MGWIFSKSFPKTPNEIKAHLDDELAENVLGERQTVEASAIVEDNTVQRCRGARGFVYYAALNGQFTAAEERRTLAVVILVEAGPETGFKHMDETMGPFYYDAPIAVMEALTNPAPNNCAENWRLKVRKVIEDRQKMDALALLRKTEAL